MNEVFETQLNNYYRALENRWFYVYAALDHRVFSLQSEYREKHSCFDASGNRLTAEYPLPVIEVSGYCEFQIESDCLSCFSKLRKTDTAVLDDAAIRAYSFDVWGEDDYYTLLYRSVRDIASAAEFIADSSEDNLIVHFRMPCEIDAGDVYGFAKLLRKRGFYI